MLANREPESVPGTGCDARSDASKQATQIGATQIGARHQVRRQVDASKQEAQTGARHQVRRQVDASKQEAQTGARHRVRR